MDSKIPSIDYFNALVDPVQASRLRPYNDGRTWILVLDPTLTLGEVAHTSLDAQSEAQFTQWFGDRKLAFYKSLDQITQDDNVWFDCLYFENAYFLRFRKN